MNQKNAVKIISAVLQNIDSVNPRNFEEIIAASLVLLVGPFEKFFKKGCTISFSNFDMAGILIKTPKGFVSDEILFRKIRNGIAHFNVDNTNGKITIHDESNGNKNFEVEMTNEKFKDLIVFIGKEYINLLK